MPSSSLHHRHWECVRRGGGSKDRHTCAHTCTEVRARAHAHVLTRTHACVCVTCSRYACTHKHMQIRTRARNACTHAQCAYTQPQMHTQMYEHVHAHTDMHAHNTCTHADTCTHACQTLPCLHSHIAHTHTHTGPHAHTWVYPHVMHTDTHVHARTCTHSAAHAHVRAHMHFPDLTLGLRPGRAGGAPGRSQCGTGRAPAVPRCANALGMNRPPKQKLPPGGLCVQSYACSVCLSEGARVRARLRNAGESWGGSGPSAEARGDLQEGARLGCGRGSECACVRECECVCEYMHVNMAVHTGVCMSRYVCMCA